jgi:hypothetical protein
LDTCFRGEAARWWNDGIENYTRDSLIHSANAEDWCQALEKRFRMPLSEAIRINDAANKRSLPTYMSSFIATANLCSETGRFFAYRNK